MLRYCNTFQNYNSLPCRGWYGNTLQKNAMDCLISNNYGGTFWMHLEVPKAVGSNRRTNCSCRGSMRSPNWATRALNFLGQQVKYTQLGNAGFPSHHDVLCDVLCAHTQSYNMRCAKVLNTNTPLKKLRPTTSKKSQGLPNCVRIWAFETFSAYRNKRRRWRMQQAMDYW